MCVRYVAQWLIHMFKIWFYSIVYACILLYSIPIKIMLQKILRWDFMMLSEKDKKNYVLCMISTM